MLPKVDDSRTAYHGATVCALLFKQNNAGAADDRDVR